MLIFLFRNEDVIKIISRFYSCSILKLKICCFLFLGKENSLPYKKGLKCLVFTDFLHFKIRAQKSSNNINLALYLFVFFYLLNINKIIKFIASP